MPPIAKKARTTESAARETCCVCDDESAIDTGAKCSQDHFTCGGCLDTLCQQALQRPPAGVTPEEKEARRIRICCMSTDGCGHEIAARSLALALTPERFAEIRSKDLEIGLHVALPDAVREHVAAADAATGGGALTRAQHEEAVRAAYRRPDGSFCDERGDSVRQCESCSYGPVIGDVNCGDMRQHHGDAAIHNGRRYRRNQSCLHCGHLNGKHFRQWPVWDGVHVLGAIDPLVEAPFAVEPVPVPPPPPRAPPHGVHRRRGAAPRGPLAIGDRVRMRAGVTPSYGFGPRVDHTTVGVINRMDGRNGCYIDFEGHADWHGVLAELERADAPEEPPLAVGDHVRMRAGVRPSYGWGPRVSETSVGVIAGMDGFSDCFVNFPGHQRWHGVLSELERASATDARPPRPAAERARERGGAFPRLLDALVGMGFDGEAAYAALVRASDRGARDDIALTREAVEILV